MKILDITCNCPECKQTATLWEYPNGHCVYICDTCNFEFDYVSCCECGKSMVEDEYERNVCFDCSK